MLTTVTKAAFAGKPFTNERDNTDNRRLNPRKRDRSKTSKPPRTRDGATHPGGKTMRRVLKRVDILARDFASIKDVAGRTAPGSRKP